jgi:death-on-curing protein
VINGFEIDASIDEQEVAFIGVASGELSRTELTDWIEQHLASLS